MDNLINKLKSTVDKLPQPVEATLKVLGIFILALIVVKLGSFIIRKLFKKQRLSKYGINDKKLNTMASLIVSIFRYTVYLIAIVTILSDVLGLKSVLAAAGVGGIAVGFGAQSLIKDIISGFFIVMEDQYVVGDLITIDNMTGNVEDLELRVTKLRNFNGDLYIIPNGEIKKVTNHTRGDKAVIVDIPVSYGSDMSKAFDIANSICEKVGGEFDTITEQPKVMGITDLGKDSLNLRITAKTIPNEHWEVERKIRRMIKEEFDKENIEFYDKNKIIYEQKPENGGKTNA
ncbi:MAG: mechanosensitive ion channel family protein [Clostridia bacterium]|nr:mechanosensitive ion channel family protein [Clostridia bacterium]